MQLPIDIRDDLVDELDEVLDAYATEPPASVVVGQLIEQFELLAEEEGYEDVIALLEKQSQLDGSLAEVLEDEVAELVDFDGEELVALLERITALDWSDDDDDKDADDDDDPDDRPGWDAEGEDWEDDDEDQDWEDGDDLFDDLDEEDDDY